MTLRDRLPDIRGTYAEAAPMARHTWFGVGGPADVIFCPRDVDDLAGFLASCPADIPLLPVGAGSNLLVRDGGVGSWLTCARIEHVHTPSCAVRSF